MNGATSWHTESVHAKPLRQSSFFSQVGRQTRRAPWGLQAEFSGQLTVSEHSFVQISAREQYPYFRPAHSSCLRHA